MTLDLETYKKDIVEQIRKKLTELDYKSLGKMVDDAENHAGYTEDFCNRLLSYAITGWVVLLMREEEARRLSNN